MTTPELARSVVAHYVHTILEEKARDILLRYHEDWWYGWVPADKDKTPVGAHYDPQYRGHWMGERHLTTAREAVRLAEAELHAAKLFHTLTETGDPTQLPYAVAKMEQAQRDLRRANTRLDRTEQRVTQAITERRATRMRKLITALFQRYYRTARTSAWPVFDPALPADIRHWVLRWKDQPSLTPSSLVFLWLVVEETIDHHRTHTLDALGGSDYLAKIPLVTQHIHTNADLDEPTRAERDYVRWLQRNTLESAHENRDPRDTRADLVYDGPARDDDPTLRCPTCQGYRTHRLIQVKSAPPRFAQALACDTYATKCRYDVVSPTFPTMDALRVHLAIETFLQV